MKRKPKKINVLVVERGKPPRSVLIPPTTAGIAEILGEGPVDLFSLNPETEDSTVFIFAVMVSRSDDVDEMERTDAPMPKINLICGVGRRGIGTLPEVHHAGLKRLYEKKGDKMLTDGNQGVPVMGAARWLDPAKIVPYPA